MLMEVIRVVNLNPNTENVLFILLSNVYIHSTNHIQYYSPTPTPTPTHFTLILPLKLECIYHTIQACYINIPIYT